MAELLDQCVLQGLVLWSEQGAVPRHHLTQHVQRLQGRPLVAPLCGVQEMCKYDYADGLMSAIQYVPGVQERFSSGINNIRPLLPKTP